jgi:Ca-activated chloride channel family protein
MFDSYQFQHPIFLIMLAAIPALIWWRYIKEQNHDVTLTIPSLEGLESLQNWKSIIGKFLPLIKYIGFAALIIALARPQKSLKEEVVKAEGIDIFMVMDLSSSMLAKDFDPDRLEVSKRVATEFISKRKYDRIGLAVFSGESFTQSPLTTDHAVVKQLLAGLQCGLLKDGTAIGMGLAAGVNRLKDSDAESKVVILLTDGVNNSGYIKPLTAAEIAVEFGVKVYTIGVGSTGEALAPVSVRDDGRYLFGMTRVEIDERLLTEIAEMTGGQFFRATSAKALEEIYDVIDSLEKTEMEITTFKRYSEEFYRFLGIGLILILIERILSLTLFRRLP